MSPSRAEAIRKALAQSRNSQSEVESCAREHALAHDAYNRACVERPRKGRMSGTDFEDLRRHVLSAYEMLLDCLRIHSDNLFHLAALKGAT